MRKKKKLDNKVIIIAIFLDTKVNSIMYKNMLYELKSQFFQMARVDDFTFQQDIE